MIITVKALIEQLSENEELEIIDNRGYTYFKGTVQMFYQYVLEHRWFNSLLEHCGIGMFRKI